MKHTKKLKIQLGKRSFRIPSLAVVLKIVTKTIPQPLFRFGRPLFKSVSYVVRRNLPLFLATVFLTPAAILLGMFIISRSRTPSAQAAAFTNAVRVSKQSTTISTAGDWYKAMAYSGDGVNGDAETGTFNPIHPGTVTDGSAGALAAGRVALTTTTYATAQFIGFKPNANGNLAGVTLVMENPTVASLSNPDIVVELLNFPSASCTTSCTNYVTGTQGAYDYPNDTVILRRTAWQFNQGLSGENVAPGNYGRATYDFRFDTPVAVVTTGHYGFRIINMGATTPVFGTWAQAPISSQFPTIDGTIRTIGIGDIDLTNSTSIVMPEVLTGNNYLTTSPMVAANSSAGIGLPTVRRTENEHWTATYSSATSNWTMVGSVSGTQTNKLTTTNNGGTGPSWVNDGVAMTTLTADITSTTAKLCVASITGFAANQTIDVWDSDTPSAPFTILSTSASDGACPSSGPSITTTASLTAAANNVTMSKNATVARAIWKQRIVQGAIQAFTADMPTTTKICVADSSRFSAPTAGTGNNIVIWDNNTLLAAATLNRVVSTSQADGACASSNSITVATVVTGGTYTLAQNAYVAEYSANLSNTTAPTNGNVLRYTAFNYGQNPTGSTLLTRTNSVNLAYAKNEALATSLVRYPFLSNRHIFFVAYGDADTSAPADGDMIIVGNGRPDPDTLDSTNLTNDVNWSTKQAHVVNIDRSWDAALAYTGVNASAVGDGAGSRTDYAAWAVTGGWVSAVIAPGSQLGIANTANAHYRINIPGKIVIDSDASLALGKTGAAIPSSSGHDIYFDNTSPAATTTLTADSAASATLTVTSTTGFQVGDIIVIDDNNSVPITRIIAAVQSGTSITLTANAVVGYTVAQGAFIAKGPTTELPTGQDRRAGPYTYNTGRVSLYAAGSSAFRTSKSDLAVDINGDINTGFLGNNLTDSGDTFLDVKDNVVGNWQPLDQISVAGGTNQLADNAFSSTGMGGTDDINQMPLWAGQQAKVDANAGGRTSLPTPNTEIAEIGTIPMTNIYNSDYNGGSALFSTNYNNSPAWTIFGDNANTEVNDAVYFGDQGSNMPYALELNIGQAQNAAASHVWEYYDASTGWTAFTPRDAYTYQVRTGVSLPLSADTVLNSLTISLAEGGTVFAADQIVKIVDNDSPAIYRRIGALTTATVLTFTEPVPAGYTTAQSATVTRLNGGQWKSMDPASIFASTGRRVLSWAPSNLSGTPAKTTINGVNAYWVRARISSFTSWTTSPTNQTTPVGMGGIERIPSSIFNVSNGVQEAKISEVTAGSSFDPNETYKVEYGNSPGWTQIVPYVPNAPYTWHIKDGTLSQNTITADTHIANGDLSWGNYTVTAKVKMRTVTDATSRKIGIVLRDNLDGNGYGVLIEKTSTGPQQRIGIYPMALGVEGTVFVNFTKAFSDNAWYWIKANVTGTGASTVISAKFWADGGGEPGSWDTTFTTNAAQGLWNTGRIGLYADAMIADFDDVSVDNGSVVLSDAFTSTGTWLVNGSINGSLGTATPGTPFTSNYINFTLKQKGGWDGVNTPEIGDKIYISSTGTRSYKGLSNTGASAITTSDTNTVYENVDFEWNPTASNYTVTGSATGAMGTATPGSAYTAAGGKIGLTIPSGSPTATKFGDHMLLLQDNIRRNNGSWIGNNGYGSAALVYPYLSLTSSTLATRYNIEGQAGTATARQRGTIDFWFKTNYSGSPSVLTHPKGMYLFDYANQGVTDRLFIRHTNDGYLEASVVGGTTQGTILRKSFSSTAGQWYHFRLGWDETAANKRAWLDGVAFTAGEGQASALAARGANLGILRIGNAWTYDAPFDGSIDEFAIFDDDFDTSGGCNFGDFTPPTSAWSGGETVGCTTGKEVGVNIFRASFDTAMNPQEGSVLADYAWGIPSILFTNGADTGNERIRVVTYPQRTRIWVDNSGEKYTPSARIKFGSGFQENAAVATLAGWSNNFTFPHKAARQSTSSPTYSPVLNLKRSTHIWSDESISLAGATMGAPINAGMGFAMGTTGLSGLSTIDFSDVSMDNQYTNFAILTNPYTGLLAKPTQRISNSVFLNFYDRAYTVTGKTQGSNYVGAYFVTTHNAAANIGSGYNASTSQNVGIDGSIFMGNRNAYVTVPPAAANGAAAFFSGRLYSVLNSEFYNNGVTGAGTSGALNFSSGVAKVTISNNIFSLNTNGIRLYGNSFFTMANNIFEGHVSDNVAPLGAEYGSGIRVAPTSSSVAIVDTDSIFGRGLWNEADIGLPPNLTTFEAESLVQFTGEGTQMLSPLLFGTADYSNMPRVADHYLASTIPGTDVRMTGSSNDKDIVNATTFGFMRTTGSGLADTTVHTNGGYGWRMEPINVDIPLEYTAKLVGVASKPLAATGYLRINSNYGSTNMPVVTLSGLGMTGANLTWTAAATPNVWQQFVVSGTPTESALAELKISTKLDYVASDSGTSEIISQATGNYLPTLLEDVDKNWTPNQWVGYKLRDVNGKVFDIVKNTNQILYLKGTVVPHLLNITFTALTSGDYVIYNEPYVYLDDISVLSATVDTGTLDFFSGGQPVSPWLSTGLTAEGVWSAQFSSFANTDGSFGQLVGDALVAQYADVFGGTPTTTVFNTNLTSTTDDFYLNGAIIFTEGQNKGAVRRISDYGGASKTVTVDPALPFAPASGDRFAILAATASSGGGGGATAADIWSYTLRQLTTENLSGGGSLATAADVANIRADITSVLTELGTGNISAIRTSTNSINWSDITGLITTAGLIKNKTDTIDWANVTGIKTKTDTIDWADVTGIKLNTDTIVWGDITTIKNNVATLITEIGTGNISGIKTKTDSIVWGDITAIKLNTDTIVWGDITTIKNNVATLITEIGTGNISAIKTKTDDINWLDITGIVTSSGDIKAKTDTIDWANVTGIKTKTDTIDWANVTGIKAKTDTIDWANVTGIKTKTDDINWSDITGIVTSSGDIKAKTDTIDWANVTGIKTKTDTIDWANVTGIKTKTDTIAWGDIGAIQSSISALNNLSAADIWTYATRSLTGEVTLTSDSRKAIWDTACAILNTSGTVGKLVCDNLDAAISTRSTLTAAQVWSEASRTITGLENPALAAIANNIWANATRSLTDYGNDITAQQVWDVLTSSLTSIDSIGKLLVTNVDETISSRASQTSLDALAGNIATLLTEIGTGNISAIKTKTDSITWADVTGLVTTSGQIKAKTDTITWADVTAVKTKTDTITWADITGIKLKTDTITWGDITSLTANIATLLTEIGTGNISAIKTKTDSITWADVTGLVTTSGQIKAKTDTITWADVTAVKTKTDTITWADITGIKLKTDTITWGDINTLTTRVDTTVSSRASQTSLDAHESADAAFRSSTTSTLGTLTVNVSAIMTQLSSIETKIDTITSTLSTIEGKIDVVDSNLDSVKSTVEDTNTKVTAIQTVTNNILAKWGSYDAATIIGYVDTLETNLGDPGDPTTATTVFGKLNHIKDSSGSGGVIDLIYAQAQSTHTKLLEVQTELGFNGKSTSAYDEMVAVKGYVDSVESSLATLDTRTSSIAASVTNVSNDLKTVTDRIGKVSVDSFTQLFEVKSTDVNYLKNKVIELKAMADIDRQLLEKVANQPIVKVVMEWGSVIIKFVIVNPSDSTTQKIPFKAFLPKEVKQEYIMDLGGLTLNYDTTTEQYYVTADITLEKGSAVTRSVEIKDIWIISEDEVASLRKQAEELSSGLKNTSYFAQGLTLKTDINTRLDKVARKQKDNNSTPQDHILAYRENVEDMKAVNDNIKGLKDLVLNSGVGGNFLASIGGIQTFATWGIILVLIFGMGALGSFYYVLWKRKVVSVAVGKGKKMKDVELPTPTPFALPGFRFTWLKGILLGWKALLTDIFSALFHVGGTMAVHSNTVVAMARSMPKKTLVILLIAGLVTVTTVGGVIVARNASGRDQKQVAGAFTNGSAPTPTVASTKAEKVDVLVSEMIKKAEERKKVNAKIIELLKKTENEATASALPVATKSPSSTQKPTPTVMQNNIQGVVEVIKNPPEAVVIRDKPDKKAQVIAKADAGKDYSFTAKVGEWYQIVLPEGKIGWIHNESVNKLGTKEMAASVDKAKVLGVASDRQQLLVIKQTPTDWLNVRKNPSAVAQIITKVYPGERYPFSELQSGWYKIVLKDMTEGWVSSEYVKPENEMLEQSNIFVEVTPPQGGVNIREKPDLESAIIKRIYIHNRYPKLGETNGWVKIEMLDDKIGYVSKEFTKDIQ